MKLSQLLADKLKEVLTEGQWVIGTNFKAQIEDLNWEEATQKMHGLNTIADLTFHTNYYIAGVAHVLEGGSLDIRDKHSFDYPPLASEQDWRNLVHKFCADAERFIQLVENLPEEKLQQTFVDEKYGTYHRNIEVIVEHTYYHFGQVVLLRKMMERANKP